MRPASDQGGLRRFADDLATLVGHTARVFPPAAMEQGRLSAVFRCVGVKFPGVSGGCETTDGCVVTDGIGTGQVTLKSVLTAAVEVITHHVTSFAEVTNALVASGSVEGLCKWFQFLDTYCHGVFRSREHLVPAEGDAIWFLEAQGFRAAVALACMDYCAFLLECGTSRTLTDCGNKLLPRVQTTTTAFTWMAALALEAASFGDEAHRWWAAGDEDREVDDYLWTHEAWLAEVRAVVMAAASDILSFGRDLIRSSMVDGNDISRSQVQRCAAVIGMVQSLDVVAAGVKRKIIKQSTPDAIRDNVGDWYGPPVESVVQKVTLKSTDGARFVLLDGPETGQIVGCLLGLYMIHAVTLEAGWSQRDMRMVLPVLAVYVGRGRVTGGDIVFREVSRVGGVLDFLRDHVGRVSEIMFQHSHVSEQDWFANPRSASRSKARMWWGCRSLGPEVSGVVRSAVGNWQGFVLDVVRRYIVDRVKQITTWYRKVVTGVYDRHEPTAGVMLVEGIGYHWTSFQTDAKMLVEVTGRVQELQDGVRTALDLAPHAGDFIATFGPPDDFMQFCDDSKRWSDSRLEWAAAVFRGGAAMRARKAAAAAAAADALAEQPLRRSKRLRTLCMH